MSGKNSSIEEERIIGISDSISYLVELIIQISKYITNGRGLSKNGVNALLLFFLTFGLIIAYVPFPITLKEGLKIFIVPLVFLLYVVVDLAKNIEKINNFFRRLGRKTDTIYDSILKGTIEHKDMNSYLHYLPFSFEQIKEIITKLIESRQFTQYAQKHLLYNNSLYRVDTLPYIKESIIEPIDIKNSSNNFEWAPSAVCLFLRKTWNNLSIEYLEKIIEKYGKYPSVLIALGYFQHYRKEDNNYYKIGYEFKYNWNLMNYVKVIYWSVSISMIILVISVFILFILNVIGNATYLFTLFVFLLVVVIITNVFTYLRNNYFKYSIKRHLKKYDFIQDNYLIEEITDDLFSSFYS